MRKKLNEIKIIWIINLCFINFILYNCVINYTQWYMFCLSIQISVISIFISYYIGKNISHKLLIIDKHQNIIDEFLKIIDLEKNELSMIKNGMLNTAYINSNSIHIIYKYEQTLYEKILNNIESLNSYRKIINDKILNLKNTIYKFINHRKNFEKQSILYDELKKSYYLEIINNLDYYSVYNIGYIVKKICEKTTNSQIKNIKDFIFNDNAYKNNKLNPMTALEDNVKRLFNNNFINIFLPHIDLIKNIRDDIKINYGDTNYQLDDMINYLILYEDNEKKYISYYLHFLENEKILFPKIEYLIKTCQV